MEDKISGALFQDRSFEFTEFNGHPLESLIACEDRQSKDVILVYIKVKEKKWYQFFLDAGYGFWQNYEDIDPIEEQQLDTEYAYVDKGTEWGLLATTITRIYAVPVHNNCSITIEFEHNKKIILKTVEPAIFDSNSELIYMSSEK